MERAELSELHRGHRRRLKRRYIRENGEGFSDHELLELLLFYSIPRHNTNEIAHLLNERFGSISGIASADVNELMLVDGVGDNTAVLLNLVLALSRRIANEKNADKKRLNTLKALVNYARTFLVGATGEQVYLVMMDNSLRIIDTKLVAVGSIKEVRPLIRNVLELSLLKRASSVALVHNHPNGGVEASHADVEFTTMLKRELDIVDIRFIEHVIIDSFSHNAILQRLSGKIDDSFDFSLDDSRV